MYKVFQKYSKSKITECVRLILEYCHLFIVNILSNWKEFKIGFESDGV